MCTNVVLHNGFYSHEFNLNYIVPTRIKVRNGICFAFLNNVLQSVKTLQIHDIHILDIDL